MIRSRLLLAAAIAALGTVLLAPPASAAVDVAPVAEALRSGESVVSDPAAPLALSTAEVDQLSAQIRDTGLPVFLAVVPAQEGVTAEEALIALNEEVGLAGIYGIVWGEEFRAGSTSGSVADLATEAFRDNRDQGTFAVLSSFVTLADERFNGTSAASTQGGSAWPILAFLVVAGGVVVLVIWRVQRKARIRQAEQLVAVRAAIDADITEYGERLGAFSLADPDMDDAARADMQRALDSYDRAKSAAGRMSSTADAGTVTTAMEDGRYALACVQARLDRQPLPERRPPCFVDPRHGPSIADVPWTPPGLTAREVPMCAACRTSVEDGGQPVGMMVPTAAGPRPYWQAGQEFEPYTRGYYSPFGSAMTGVLVGTMVAGMWAAPAAAAPAATDSFGGGGDFGGFGGFGGGGGDFGGGDFGGGDF
jgi:uncharacterized membrane protein YgcG